MCVFFLSSPLGIGATVEVNIDVTKCENITNLEHVTANVSFSFHRRGDVKITLISPSGTPSEMISYRDNDASEKGIKHFPFMSVHKWGENPLGRWTLRIETRNPQTRESRRTAQENDAGQLIYFGLRLFGSYTSNNGTNQYQKRQESNSFVPNEREIEWIYKRELTIRESPHVMQKRDYQNLINDRQQRQNIETDHSLFSTFRKKFGF